MELFEVIPISDDDVIVCYGTSKNQQKKGRKRKRMNKIYVN